MHFRVRLVMYQVCKDHWEVQRKWGSEIKTYAVIDKHTATNIDIIDKHTSTHTYARVYKQNYAHIDMHICREVCQNLFLKPKDFEGFVCLF